MSRVTIACLSALLFFQHCLSDVPSREGSKPVKHTAWTKLLEKYVDEDGNVYYAGFRKDSTNLNLYLNMLTEHPPDEQSWSDEEQIAYWVNLYNAFTIKLIIQHYPIQSIKDIGSKIQIPFINSPWDIKFIEINEKKLDLNNVEHSILRKNFNEPRIHFAINCASFSCPKLRREAYDADRLEEQLHEQAIEFINDEERNLIFQDKAELSKIFSWFKGDFIKKGTLVSYINLYADNKITKKTKISFMDYDWSLNDQH